MFHTYYFYIALIPSVILHEVSHGWVANHFGDPTAKNAHRLTLNPLAHIDPFGTITLFWSRVWHACVVWALLALPAMVLLALVLRPIFAAAARGFEDQPT